MKTYEDLGSQKNRTSPFFGQDKSISWPSPSLLPILQFLSGPNGVKRLEWQVKHVPLRLQDTAQMGIPFPKN